MITKNIREKILERDNFVCVICKSDDVRLHVHHLDKNQLNNSEDNLFTLCARCHSYIHGRATSLWWI